MYWESQEKIIFYLVFLVVFTFQISTFFVLTYIEILGQILFIAFNSLVFYGMIIYARWVWKKINFLRAFKKVIITEMIFILISGGLFLIGKLII
jgi:hypothetical protein